LSAIEIEKRNAAAAFASVREASLFLLLGECNHLMTNSSVRMDVVARAWFDRNKPELEATYVWLDKYIAYLQATNPAKYNQALTELGRSTGDGVLQSARLFFARKQPDLSNCEKASKTFSVPQVDLKNMALNPGYEQFAEFPETLARIRAEASFSVPPNLKFGMDKAAQSLASIGNIASLDAAEAAKERGDGLGRIAVFKGMAERGDGKAAQQIGLIYLNGQQVEKNPISAYRWFYAAWSLAEMEGLSALGVMHRDGLGVPVNLPLAQATFYLAKAAARTREAFDRALSNLDRLENRISSEEKSRVACMSLSSLDSALQMPVRALEALVISKPISNNERRLGVVVKDLAETYKTAICQ
jgi:Sel1 repeat